MISLQVLIKKKQNTRTLYQVSRPSINGETEKCKTKAIKADLGIFIHIPGYSSAMKRFEKQLTAIIIFVISAFHVL